MPTYKLEDLPELITIVEAASVLRVMPLTLKRWEKAGKIHPIRINSRGDRRYKKIDILKIVYPLQTI